MDVCHRSFGANPLLRNSADERHSGNTALINQLLGDAEKAERP